MISQCEGNGLGNPANVPVIGRLTFHGFILLLAFVFTIVSCLLSSYQIFQHATSYTRPGEQSQIIRIILLAPMQSIPALLSINFYRQYVYLRLIYQFYDALVLAAFFLLLCQYSIPDHGTLEEGFGSKGLKPWFFLKPFQLCGYTGHPRASQDPTAGRRRFNIIWLGVFQYCLAELLVVIAVCVTEHIGVYCAESSSTMYAHFWINIIQSVSLVFVVNCLIQLYFQCRTSLAPNKPGLKFIAVKIVIFIVLIQTVIFDHILGSQNGPIKPSESVAFSSLAVGVPNAILCLEMAVVAVLHLYAFPSAVYAVTLRSADDVNLSTVGRTVRFGQSISPAGTNRTLEPTKSLGGFLGWRAYLDALSFVDIGRSVVKGPHQLFAGQHQGRLEG